MEKKFSFNLILKEHVQKLLDDFATVMNVHIVFFGRDGSELRRGREEGCSPFCRLMQQEYFSLKDCMELDEAMEKKCAQSRKCECYICHAHLGEAVMPVIDPGGALLGFLMFGQFRCSRDLPETLLAKAKTPAQKKQLKELYEQLPYYNDQAVRKMSGLLEMLVDYIVRCELVALEGDSLYTRTCSYIDTNFSRKITIAHAAKALGVSVSGLSHFLQANGQGTFVELLTKRRLDHADKLLLSHPEMTIAEIALLSGFPDPYYFSRVYKKHRGSSPGKRRKKSI